jgi:co-chaperonin GroES (HSP10)
VIAEPIHHYASLRERTDIDERLHSRTIFMSEASVSLRGANTRARLFEVVECGPGRMTNGVREGIPCEPGQLVYVNTYNVAHRVLCERQALYWANMGAIMARLDKTVEEIGAPGPLSIEPLGEFVLTKADEKKMRRIVLGDSKLHLPGQGEIASDDANLTKLSYETVVKVGPGKPSGPGWETPGCEPGDVVLFTKTAIASEVTLAGQTYTLVPWSHVIARIAGYRLTEEASNGFGTTDDQAREGNRGNGLEGSAAQ